jgi:hypothetical protein
LLPEVSAETLMGKAADCTEIAKAQHDAADAQHVNADKLDALAHQLEASAVEIAGKTLMDADRGR